MSLFALGMRHKDGTERTVLAYVTADAPDAPITGIDSAGDDFLFTTVCGEVFDRSLADKEATPFTVSVGIAGRDATVHRVTSDGSLIGWRREYNAEPPTLS